MQYRVYPFLQYTTSLFLSWQRLWAAAAAERQVAVNVLDMDESSCRFGCARSCSVKIIKGAKKAARYPKTRCSPQSLARRLASSLFLPAASSYHEVLTLTQQAKTNAARAEAEAARRGKV
jgi:hypothetical protein